jgi:hypothetical protein
MTQLVKELILDDKLVLEMFRLRQHGPVCCNVNNFRQAILQVTVFLLQEIQRPNPCHVFVVELL